MKEIALNILKPSKKELERGLELHRDAVVIDCYGFMPRAAVDGNRITIDENMMTTVPGLYAAGDCTGGIMQISTAVGEGATAALAIIRNLSK